MLPDYSFEHYIFPSEWQENTNTGDFLFLNSQYIVTDLCSVIQKNQNETKVRKKLNISLFKIQISLTFKAKFPKAFLIKWMRLKPKKMQRNQWIGA